MIRFPMHPAALIFLCFALLGSPVSYRGGAADAHPHMFLEFVMDASAGVFAHHHGEPSAEAENHRADHSHTHGHGHDGATADQPSQSAAEAGRFAPSLSAFVVGDIGQFTSILPQHEDPLHGAFASAFHPFGRSPTGLTHAPTSPPPR